jgi:uncharacterized membrane protein YccC
VNSDPLELRFARMARARERCFQELRHHYGQHLPPPVVAAVCDLAETLMRLSQTPDEDLETTFVGRKPT